MLNIECLMLNGTGARRARRTFNIQHSTFSIPVLLLLAFALPATANELSADRRTLLLTDSVTITLVLTGSFAKLDDVRVPVQNLTIEAGPAAASNEFGWSNAGMMRRKVLRWTAYPLRAGAALVGPLTLRAPDGQVETLPPVSIQILPDPAAGTNDPQRIMRELVADQRSPVFIIAEADRSEVMVGEEVVVTWTLYSATMVQKCEIGDPPRLADFWSEELDVSGEQPVELTVGGVRAQKLVIRRVALFPLRSGALSIDPMPISATALRRTDTSDRAGDYEGEIVVVHWQSAAVPLEVRPLHPGPSVDLVGDADLQCSAPQQANGGPVTLDVVLQGRANLRAAKPPQFAQPVEGSVQIADRPLTVQRGRGEARMARRWRYLIFPEANGALVIPPLRETVLTPAGERQELRCVQRMVMVSAAEPPQPAAATPAAKRSEAARRALPWAGAIALALVALAIAVPPIERGRLARRESRGLLRPTAAETRAAVEAWLAERGIDPLSLLREASDRGDAWRAVRSLLDALEHERVEAQPREVRRRVRELVETVGR